MRIILTAIFLAATALASSPQSAPPAAAQSSTSTVSSSQITVPANVEWVDTKLDLHGGAKLRLTGTGSITYAQGQPFGPDGLPRTWKDMLHQYAVPNAGHGALIGRLGSGDAAQAFLVGASMEYDVPVGGPIVSWNQSEPGRRFQRHRRFPGKN